MVEETTANLLMQRIVAYENFKNSGLTSENATRKNFKPFLELHNISYDEFDSEIQKLIDAELVTLVPNEDGDDFYLYNLPVG